MTKAKMTGWLSNDNCPVIPIIYLFIPFCFLDVGFVHAGHRMGLLIGLLIILALKIPNQWLRYFLLYAAILFLITTSSFVLENINFFSYERKLVFDRLVFLIVGIIIYLLILDSNTSTKWFYNVFCIGTLIQFSIALIQKCGFDPILWLFQSIGCKAYSKLPIDIGMGSLGNNNFLAAMIAITIPFFFRKYWIYCVPFLLIQFFSLKTSTAIISLAIGLLLYFGLSNSTCFQNIFVTIFIIFFVLIYIFYCDQPIWKSPRFKYWFTIIENLWLNKKALFFGFGPKAVLPFGIKSPLHNEWLQGIYHYGVIGISFLITYVITISRKNKILFVAFIIACVNAVGNYPMHLAPSAFLILIIMGLIQRESTNG
ncbi:MAG: hypothetical protein ACFFB3_06610 [Candidatus Hodarchaeota archaeon]